ncbi:hypothetical protein [Micromonospora rubida]
MDERPHTGPLPPAHPVADGPPPLADGDTIPQPTVPPGPALTRRQYLIGWLCVALVVAAAVIGMLR